MKKGKMLSISLLITTCLVLLCVVLLFLTQDDVLIKVKEQRLQNDVQNAAATNTEEPEDGQIEYRQQGIRLVENDDAIRDIMFDKEALINLKSGPISLKVTNVSLELLLPKSVAMQHKVEGFEKVTVVRLQVESSNTSSLPVMFDLSTLTAGADVGEATRIDRVFSTSFSSVYEANEVKKGELVLLFKSNPDFIATVWLNVRSPFNKNGENLGENSKLKIPLY